MKILQGQLVEERRQREELEERMRAERDRMRAEREAEQHRMSDILAYMQTLGAATGVAPPPSLFMTPPRPPPPPADPFSTPVSMDKF
jgi:hypothetical protein